MEDALSLEFAPLRLVRSDEQTVLIEQPISADPQDVIQIHIKKAQAIQVAEFLLDQFRPKRQAAEPSADKDAGFDDFWQAYPRHRRVAKAQCLQKWRSRGLSALAPVIVEHVRRQAASEAWTKSAGLYVPMPMTYLNQSRWEADAEGNALDAALL